MARDVVLQDIEVLIGMADHLSDHEFRLEAESLASRGGAEVQNHIIHTITTSTIERKIRINLIRMAGYLQHANFILPLKRILESESDTEVRIAAILCLSKYNDKRTLDILHRALERIDKPELQTMIKEEIRKIKQNNPLLALMPVFLDPLSNSLTISVVVKIFKKILHPADVRLFIPYLTHNSPRVTLGTFEILCHCGDAEVSFILLDHLRQLIERRLRGNEPGWRELGERLSALQHFHTRLPIKAEHLHPLLTPLHTSSLPADVASLLQQLES